MKVGDQVFLKKIFLMDEGGFPDLTEGKSYVIDYVSEQDRDFRIVDDAGDNHYFNFFGDEEGNGFKTEDYFELVN